MGRSIMISSATNPLKESRKESLLRCAGSTSICVWLVCDLGVIGNSQNQNLTAPSPTTVVRTPSSPKPRTLVAPGSISPFSSDLSPSVSTTTRCQIFRNTWPALGAQSYLFARNQNTSLRCCTARQLSTVAQPSGSKCPRHSLRRWP